MAILSCPFPENINPLTPNGFMLTIEKLPEITFFCQQASIPGINLPNAKQATPFVNIGHKGEQLDYMDLTVDFLVDSEMKNYKAINRWMTESFPGKLDEPILWSDGSLLVLNNTNQTVATIKFANMLPVALQGLTFASTNNDVQYLVGSVTFEYTYYEFA